MRDSLMHMRRHQSKEKQHSVAHENTYQMEPRKRFQSFRAKRAAQMVVDKFLKEETEYSKDMASNLTTVISQEVMNHMKNLHYERYRYVAQTIIGQKKNQGLQVSSRALFDVQLDSFAEYLFENKHLWCVVLVHGIYLE